MKSQGKVTKNRLFLDFSWLKAIFFNFSWLSFLQSLIPHLLHHKCSFPSLYLSILWSLVALSLVSHSDCPQTSYLRISSLACVHIWTSTPLMLCLATNSLVTLSGHPHIISLMMESYVRPSTRVFRRCKGQGHGSCLLKSITWCVTLGPRFQLLLNMYILVTSTPSSGCQA